MISDYLDATFDQIEVKHSTVRKIHGKVLSIIGLIIVGISESLLIMYSIDAFQSHYQKLEEFGFGFIITLLLLVVGNLVIFFNKISKSHERETNLQYD